MHKCTRHPIVDNLIDMKYHPLSFFFFVFFFFVVVVVVDDDEYGL